VPATFSLKNISLTKTEDDPKLKQKGFWEASVEATILKSDKTK
jgi:fatty-acid desaturase